MAIRWILHKLQLQFYGMNETTFRYCHCISFNLVKCLPFWRTVNSILLWRNKPLSLDEHYWQYPLNIWQWWLWFHWIVCLVNTMEPEQNGCHIADDISLCIFLKYFFFIFEFKFLWNLLLRAALALSQHCPPVMAWHRTGDAQIAIPTLTKIHDTWRN